MPHNPSPSPPLPRASFVSAARTLRVRLLAPSARTARAALRPRSALGATLRPAPRSPRAARTPFQLSVNPSLLSLTAAAGCVI
jgi:hypothetical protein